MFFKPFFCISGARHQGYLSQLLIFNILLLLGTVSYTGFSQCTTCDFTATSGQSYNFNGNQTLCITSNVNNINWNMNGSNNTICVATGATWDAGYMGTLSGGTIIEVYGTLNITQAPNINGGTAIMNIHAGATVNIESGINQGLTVNNGGILNFTANGTTVNNSGISVINNNAGATLNALSTRYQLVYVKIGEINFPNIS